MKKIVVLLFLFFGSTITFAQQQSDTIVTNESKFSLGISISPIYSFHTYPNNLSSDFIKLPKLQCGFGLISRFNVCRYFRLNVGLSYDRLAYTFKYLNAYSPQNGNEFKYYYSLLNLSINPYLKIVDGRFGCSLFVGTKLDYLCSSFEQYPTGIKAQIFETGSTAFLLNGGFEWEYKFCSTFSLFGEPSISKALTSFRKYSVNYPGEYLDNYINYFQINAGIIYTPKK